MTEPQHRRAVERRLRIRSRIGLGLILIGVLGFAATLFAAVGWWAVPLCSAAAVVAYGWHLAAEDPGSGTRPGTSPGTPAGPGPGTRSRDFVAEVDTEHPDPGQFIPGELPGTFTPPPPSRDSSRDFDRY